jgi:hypothetical protein
MSTRGVIVVSVLFGLFALCFGVLGMRALALGPDAPAPVSAREIAQREAAADRTAAAIRAVRADVPPALPAVPDLIPAASPAPRQGPLAAPSSAAQFPAVVDDDDHYEDDDRYQDDDDRYEDEDDHYEDDDRYEGDDDRGEEREWDDD